MEQIGPSYAQIFALLLQFWPLWLILGTLVVLRLAVEIYKHRRLAMSGIADIDKMTGAMFEQYLEILFHNHGYKVERTGKTGDYGADLVICKDGIRTIVQAKRYKKNVNLKAVQEAVAAKAMYKCSQAMVVTNSYFAKSALVLARENGVELWDREQLVRMILAGQKKGAKSLVETGQGNRAP